MFASVVYILTVSLPILVASIFGMVYIQFGYQLHMFCLEMILIEVTIIIMMSVELYKIRKHMKKQRQFRFKPDQMKKSSLNVLAGFENEENDSEPGL